MQYLSLLVCLIGLGGCGAAQTADKAATARTKQVLAYIAGVPGKGKVLSGQFAGFSPDTFNTEVIDGIHKATGQTPAILGCDWACGWNKNNASQLIINYACNPSLKRPLAQGRFSGSQYAFT